MQAGSGFGSHECGGSGGWAGAVPFKVYINVHLGFACPEYGACTPGDCALISLGSTSSCSPFSPGHLYGIVLRFAPEIGM